MQFAKGHGTGNDFVLIPDLEGRLNLDPTQVAALCDRRFGLGADGVLRVVPSSLVGEAPAMSDGAMWFMDYRNGDGSIAEMCGNGARVFAKFLSEEKLVDTHEFVIGTRGGPRKVRIESDGMISIEMGSVLVQERDSAVVSLDERTWPATPATAPNPHAVAFVASVSELADIESAEVTPEASFPDGANIEFVEIVSPTSIKMEVHERGSGRTLSCGTGACAAAAVHREFAHEPLSTVTVMVPGGEVMVDVRGTETWLSGPAEIVARGELDESWWAAR